MAGKSRVKRNYFPEWIYEVFYKDPTVQDIVIYTEAGEYWEWNRAAYVSEAKRRNPLTRTLNFGDGDRWAREGDTVITVGGMPVMLAVVEKDGELWLVEKGYNNA